MSDTNKQIIEKANAVLAKGNTDEFLSLCAEDVEWTIFADSPSTMKGQQAIREFMKSSPGSEAPDFTVDNLIADGDFVVSHGKMTMQDKVKRCLTFSATSISSKTAKLPSFEPSLISHIPAERRPNAATWRRP